MCPAEPWDPEAERAKMEKAARWNFIILGVAVVIVIIATIFVIVTPPAGQKIDAIMAIKVLIPIIPFLYVPYSYYRINNMIFKLRNNNKGWLSGEDYLNFFFLSFRNLFAVIIVAIIWSIFVISDNIRIKPVEIGILLILFGIELFIILAPKMTKVKSLIYSRRFILPYPEVEALIKNHKDKLLAEGEWIIDKWKFKIKDSDNWIAFINLSRFDMSKSKYISVSIRTPCGEEKLNRRLREAVSAVLEGCPL